MLNHLTAKIKVLPIGAMSMVLHGMGQHRLLQCALN